MVKQSRLTAREAETLLLNAGFNLIRSKGSHRIYKRYKQRIVIPFHSGKTLHPKLVKKVLEAVQEKD